MNQTTERTIEYSKSRQGGINVTLESNRTHIITLVPKKAHLLGCSSIPGITFETGKSFIRPTVVGHLKPLEALKNKFPDAKIFIFGHTDKVGDDLSNKKLSQRRATSVFAFITNQEDEWEKLYTNENWGTKAIQTILKDFGGPYDPGPVTGTKNPQTTQAISNFQGDNGLAESGDADQPTRKVMFRKYMTGKHDIVLTKGDFLSPPYHGCGEFNPLIDTESDCETNRRVIFYLFAPDALPDFPCKNDDIAPCRTQIAKSTPRLSPTFRCAFYDATSKKCVCEQPTPKTTFISMVIKSPTGEPLASTPYVFEVDGGVSRNTTKPDGSIREEIPADATDAFLTINTWRMKISIHDLKPVSETIGAKARLNNMGFYSGEPIDNSISDDFKNALRRFQTFYDLAVTGVLDAPTQRKLEEMHGF